MSLPHKPVSVIFTVLNESKNVQRLLDSLAIQTRLPNEVVICDGGSVDDTVAQIDAWIASHPNLHVQLIVEPGANISRGRNVAIAAACGPIIATTDAGVRLADDWLARLIEPWALKNERNSSALSNSEPLAVAGFFLPDVDDIFTTAMGATVLPLQDDIEPEKFLPSSRSVAFTKKTWEAAGGYPEWLDFCEDLLFDFAINAQVPTAKTAFSWAPKAIAYFQPRTNLISFWKQYYQYARGDGKADLWRKRHIARYITYLIMLPLLLGLIGMGGVAGWVGLGGLLAGVFAYCYRPWQRVLVLGADLSEQQRLAATVLVPLIRFVGDVAKMVGYPVGLLWRWQNRSRPEIQWRDAIATQHHN